MDLTEPRVPYSNKLGENDQTVEKKKFKKIQNYVIASAIIIYY